MSMRQSPFFVNQSMHIWLPDSAANEGTLLVPGNEPNWPASCALSSFATLGLADGTCNAYRNGAIRFLDFLKKNHPYACDEMLLTFPTKEVFDATLKSYFFTLNAQIVPSQNEKGVYHVHVIEELRSSVGHDLCGVFHLMEGLVMIGFTRDNPMKVPMKDRQRKALPFGAGENYNAPTVGLKFRFRMPASNVAKIRTESDTDLPYIIPALIDFGVPTSVELQTRYAIDACLRRFERISPSIWDHWQASQFGDIVFGQNKASAGESSKMSTISRMTLGRILFFGEGERQHLDTQGWKLSQWREYLDDPKIPFHVKRALASKEPLLPTQKGRFLSKSGYSDYYYAPAMKKGGLVTRTHYTRHCGVHQFLDYVDCLTHLTADQRNEMRLSFGRALGWAWPEAMLAHYSLPQRRRAVLKTARHWHLEREAYAAKIASGEFSPCKKPLTTSEPQLSALARHAVETVKNHG